MRPRVIPHLLLSDQGLYKGTQFRHHRYIGDPLNTIKLFNELYVDELIITDYRASSNKSGPDIDYLREIASEAFMPLTYGGGITTLDQIQQIFAAGYEKVALNTTAHKNPELIKSATNRFGSQSIVVSIDYKKNWLGKKRVRIEGGSNKTDFQILKSLKTAIQNGAGEILLCSIDHEGQQKGYDLETINSLSQHCTIPLVASGGAGSLKDIKSAYLSGASAAAAGSLFVFQGPHKAVLINYPDSDRLDQLFS